jgi:hypothetical protein
VLNAASIDSDSPAGDIPESYLRIINSNTAEMANRELQHQMSKLGLLDTGFAHGLAMSLYMGDIMWNTQTTPSNLPPLPIFELEPLLLMQTARCLHLHLLSKNTEGKSLDKTKASQIQDSKPRGHLRSYSKLFNFIRASPLFYLAFAARSSSEQIQSPPPSNPRK